MSTRLSEEGEGEYFLLPSPSPPPARRPRILPTSRLIPLLSLACLAALVTAIVRSDSSMADTAKVETAGGSRGVWQSVWPTGVPCVFLDPSQAQVDRLYQRMRQAGLHAFETCTHAQRPSYLTTALSTAHHNTNQDDTQRKLTRRTGQTGSLSRTHPHPPTSPHALTHSHTPTLPHTHPSTHPRALPPPLSPALTHSRSPANHATPNSTSPSPPLSGGSRVHCCSLRHPPHL